MPRPKPPCHIFNLVRTKVLARFELVAQSAHDDGPVGGAILIRRKSPVVRTPDCLRRINLLFLNTAQGAGHQTGQIDLAGSKP
jgi:hypothetical protein